MPCRMEQGKQATLLLPMLVALLVPMPVPVLWKMVAGLRLEHHLLGEVLPLLIPGEREGGRTQAWQGAQ